MVIDVYSPKGKVIGSVSLSKEIFATKASPRLLAQAVRAYLANKRVGTASTKTRGEVEGSTRKIYRQKHTGRARHGARRAPIFVGGGIVFGPKPRDFHLSLPQKMKKRATLAALTTKFREKKVKVIDGLEKLEPKTKILSQAINNLQISGNVLLVLPSKNSNKIKMGTRNIKKLTTLPVNLLNSYDVLKNKTIVFTKQSLEEIL